MNTSTKNVFRKTSIILALLLTSVYAFAQNPYWFFPPNYVDMRTGTVLNLPNTSVPGNTYTHLTDFSTNIVTDIPGTPLNKAIDYTSARQLNDANGYIKNDGSLAFYFCNRAIVAPQQTVLLKGFPFTGVTYNAINAIVPVPGTTNSFFVISSTSAGLNSTDIAVQYKQINLDTPGGMQVIDKGNITAPSSAGTAGFPASVITGITLSKLNVENGINGYNLYLQGNYISAIYRVSSTGIMFKKSINTFAEIFESSDLMTEFELTADQTKLYYTKTGTVNEDVWEYDLSSGSATPVNTYILGDLSNFVRISGVEYSPTNNRIYFAENFGFRTSSGVKDNTRDNAAGSPYLANRGKIGYFTRNITGGTINQSRNVNTIPLTGISYVAGSDGLGNSQLEMGPDGLIYASDGTHLKGFDPKAANPSIIKIITITNPVNKIYSGSSYLEFYTLVNQTDGMDYAALSAPFVSVSKSMKTNYLIGNINVGVPFTALGTFNADNVFTAQLSDASGSFANPVNLGTLTRTTSGSMYVMIPTNTPPGTGYRIRVISSSPATIGPDNGANITLSPAQIITGIVSPTSYVTGSIIAVPFTTNGGFNMGNMFFVQLSNSSGSFASPTTIANVSSSVPGTINAVIPAGTPAGTGYRVRIVSSSPAATGSVNAEDITITPPPSITTGALSSSSLCAGNSLTVPFTASGTFQQGNIFKAQLSDANGSFASSGYLTTIKTNAASLVVIIPSGTPNGSSYRVRIVATNPSTTGKDNGSNLTISTLPAFTVTPDVSDICAGDIANISVNDVSNLTYSWSPSASVTLNSSDGRDVSVNPTTNTVYSVTGVSAAGCKKTATATVNVYQCRKALVSNSSTESQSQLKIYPNPTKESVFIAAPLHADSRIRIISSRGVVVREFTQSSNEKIEVSGLDDGIYLVSYISKGKTEYHRLQVSK